MGKKSHRVIVALTLGFSCVASCRNPSRTNPSSDVTHAASTITTRTENAAPITPSTAGARTVDVDEYGTRYFVPNGTNSPPFVLLLHGLGGSGMQIVKQLELGELAHNKHFAFAAPDGSVDDQGRRFWDAGPTCCNFSRRSTDDLTRLSNTIQHAVKELRVDAKRVVVIGYSNGGFMAHRLGCEFSDRIRAIVSIAAAGPGVHESCAPSHPVAVLEIHGSDDKIVPFDGGHLFGRSNFPESTRVTDGILPWQKRNGCRGTLHVTNKEDLIPELPSSETELWGYDTCAVSVQLWKIMGGGHLLPLGGVAQNQIWQFIQHTFD